MWVMLAIACIVCLIVPTGYLLDDKLESLLYVGKSNTKSQEGNPKQVNNREDSETDLDDSLFDDETHAKPKSNKGEKKPVGRKSVSEIDNMNQTQQSEAHSNLNDDLDDELEQIDNPLIRGILGKGNSKNVSVDDLAEQGLDYALGGKKKN